MFTTQSAANNQDTDAPLTWDALRNMGIPISYQAFARRWEQEEQLPPEQQTLHNKVEKFDGVGLTLKTSNHDAQQGQQQDAGQSEMSKMAMSATKRGDLA